MSVLDTFFTNPPKLEQFFMRKLQLPASGSFALSGARGSGKSALVIDYISTLNHEFLYIDCQDPIFILEDIEDSELEYLIKEENIKTVVLDHYFEGFLDSLPKVEQLIVVSREPLDIDMPKFTLYPLDFEEFINFKKTTTIESTFSLYTKFGSLPRVAKSSNPALSSRELFFEKFDEQEGKVFLVLALFQGKIATSHLIYKKAKEYFKISKDWLYKTIKMYEKEGLLIQIPTLERGVGNKFFIYDFAFSKYLNKHEPFNVTFDSLVALALMKYRIEVKATISPLGYLNSENEFYQLAPFYHENQSWQKAQQNFGFYTNNKIKKVTILTVNANYSFEIKDTTFTALPFYEWVAGL